MRHNKSSSNLEIKFTMPENMYLQASEVISALIYRAREQTELPPSEADRKYCLIKARVTPMDLLTRCHALLLVPAVAH